MVDPVRGHEGAVLHRVHTGRDAGTQRARGVGVGGNRDTHVMGVLDEHPQRGLVELRFPWQRPRRDVAPGHHHLDHVDAAAGTDTDRSRDVHRRRLRPDQEVAVPPGCRDRRAAGQDAGKGPVAPGGVSDLDYGVVAVAEVLHRGHPARQSPVRVRDGLCSLRRGLLRERVKGARLASPGHVLMAIDQPRQQRRAGTVLHQVRAVGCGLDGTHLQDRSAVVDEDLTARPHGLPVEDAPRGRAPTI